MHKRLIVYRTQSITLCSHLSIDEKSSKINIEVRITKNFKKWQYLLTRIS